MGGMVAADAPVPAVDARSLNKTLADIEKVTGNSSEGRAWRKYLLVDSLREWAARRRNGNERVPADLAQQVRAAAEPDVDVHGAAAIPHVRSGGGPGQGNDSQHSRGG